MDYTLDEVAGYVPQLISREKLVIINADLMRRGG
jgi:hypothetical protein